MSVLATRAPSRTATLVVVAAAHIVVLWAIWRIELPPETPAETFASVIFFIPPAATRVSRPTRVAIAPAAVRPVAVPALDPRPASSVAPGDSGTAITLPGTRPGAVDWYAQIPAAAAAAMGKEQQAQRQLVALMGRFVLEADPSEANQRAPTRFRWNDAALAQDGARNWIATLHLNEHCVLIGFVIPDCAIDRIRTPRTELEFEELRHDTRLVTPGPNTVP